MGYDVKAEAETWKRLFYLSIKDSLRRRLSLADLVGGSWSIVFHKMDKADPRRVCPIRFDAAGVALIDADTTTCFRFQLKQQGTKLVLEGVPELAVERRMDSSSDAATGATDWGWLASNYFFTVSSVDIPMPLYVRQLMLQSGLRPR
jgi:hypothetical protein